MAKDRLVDKRIVDRNIQKGLLTEAEYKKFIDSLPDVADKGVFVEYSEGEPESDEADDE